MKFSLAVFGFLVCLAVVRESSAQITYTDDIIVEGNLAVGTSTERGSVNIMGLTGSTAAPALKVDGDGGVRFLGTHGQGPSPVSPGGSVFLWSSKRSALRIGNGGAISDLPDHSIVLGRGSEAMAVNSTAISGGYTNGENSVALGLSYTEADNATAMSGGYAFGYNSVAMSGGETEGQLSNAFSNGVALGKWSTAMNYGKARGDYSLASGKEAYAGSAYSVAFGRNSSVSGDRYNWVETDPLFVVSNGTGVSTDPAHIKNRDALVVYKNGAVKITKRQGDILMGEFGLPE